MNAIDKSISTDISLGHLLDVLAVAPDSPLVFTYEGNQVRPGYHVTEVKAGDFSALDCGANPEAWSEIFVQLWDIDEGGRTHMPAGKFSAIIRKVYDHVRPEPSAKLTFEVSDGIRPLALYCASAPSLVNGTFEVALAARPSSCKPRDRWLAERQMEADGSCASNARGNCCS
jgi:hypothetical protein